MGGLRHAPRPAPAGGSPLERCRGGNLPPVGFGYDDSRSIPPPIFFSVLWKRKWAVDGPKEKAAFCAAHAATGVSRIGSGKDWRSSAGSRRTLPISRPLSRACQLGGHRGGKSHGPCACPRCRSMVPRGKVSGSDCAAVCGSAALRWTAVRGFAALRMSRPPCGEMRRTPCG